MWLTAIRLGGGRCQSTVAILFLAISVVTMGRGGDGGEATSICTGSGCDVCCRSGGKCGGIGLEAGDNGRNHDTSRNRAGLCLAEPVVC